MKSWIDRISRVGKRTPASIQSSPTPSRSDVIGATAPAPYPRELEHVAVLAEGARVFIRPITPDDEPRLADLYSRLGEQTAYQRFFTLMRRLPPTWFHVFANVDYRRRLALVAEHDRAARRELIGVGRYEWTGDEGPAEVALVVQDGWQGRGLGTVLLEDILKAGAARGIRRFSAYVLADNDRMLRLLTNRVNVLERKLQDGVVAMTFAPKGDSSALSSSPES